MPKLKLHYSVQYPHRKQRYRTFDGAVAAAFRFLRVQQKEVETRRIAYLEVVNAGVVCRLLATRQEICVNYVRDLE